MKTQKKLDCLRMKRDIQAKLYKKWAGLTIDEIQAAIRHDLATSQSDMAKWWRSMEKSKGKDGGKPS